MTVPVVQVRIVRVPVHQRDVAVPVRVPRVRRHAVGVRMPVVAVVDVAVLVLDPLVHVLMAVALRQMQVEAERHEAAGRDQCPGERLVKQGDPQNGAYERRRGEVGPGSRRPQVAKRGYEQGKADAITEEADDARGNDVGKLGQGGGPKAQRQRNID